MHCMLDREAGYCRVDMTLANLTTSGWFMLWFTLVIVIDAIQDLHVDPLTRTPFYNKQRILVGDMKARHYWSPMFLSTFVTYVLWLMTP